MHAFAFVTRTASLLAMLAIVNASISLAAIVVAMPRRVRVASVVVRRVERERDDGFDVDGTTTRASVGVNARDAVESRPNGRPSIDPSTAFARSVGRAFARCAVCGASRRRAAPNENENENETDRRDRVARPTLDRRWMGGVVCCEACVLVF